MTLKKKQYNTIIFPTTSFPIHNFPTEGSLNVDMITYASGTSSNIGLTCEVQNHHQLQPTLLGFLSLSNCVHWKTAGMLHSDQKDHRGNAKETVILTCD